MSQQGELFSRNLLMERTARMSSGNVLQPKYWTVLGSHRDVLFNETNGWSDIVVKRGRTELISSFMDKRWSVRMLSYLQVSVSLVSEVKVQKV